MKKTISVIATLLFALALAAAQERVIIPEANLRFKANDDFTEVTITRFDNAQSFRGKYLEIPSEIQGVPVTAIGEMSFNGAGAISFIGEPSGIEGIFIPDSIKRIGNGAFSLSNVKTIHLPEGLEVIEGRVFESCSATFINIPSTVKVIGERAFHKCHIESVTVPASCEYIAPRAFSECKMKKLVLPPSRVILAGDGRSNYLEEGVVFPECNQLEEIEIPEDFEAYTNEWNAGIGTLSGCIWGAKIAASFALQKKLKSVKVRSIVVAYNEDDEAALEAFNAAIDSGDYDGALQIALAFRENIKNYWFDDYEKRDPTEKWETQEKIATEIKEHSAAYDEAVAAGKYLEAAQIATKEDWDTSSLGASRIWKKRTANALITAFDTAFAAKDYEAAMQIAYDAYKGEYSTTMERSEWWEKVDQVWYADTLPKLMQQMLDKGAVHDMDGKRQFVVPAESYEDNYRLGEIFNFTIKVGDKECSIYEKRDDFIKIFNDFTGTEYTLKETNRKHYLVREATAEDFAAAEQAKREAEAKAAEEARLAAEKQAEEARRAHEAAIESAFKEGKLHTNLYYIRLSSKKGEVLFDNVPVACEEAGIKKKDVLTAASISSLAFS